MRRTYAAIEIGSSNTRLVVAEYTMGQVFVLASKELDISATQTVGIKNLEAASTILKQAISDIEHKNGLKIKSLILTMSPSRANIYNRYTTIHNDVEESLSTEHVKMAEKKLWGIYKLGNEKIVSVEPYTFILDNFYSYEQAPINKEWKNLTVKAKIYTLPNVIVNSYLELFSISQVKVAKIYLTPISSAKEIIPSSILSDKAVLVDIGYQTTTISFFSRQLLQTFSILNLGFENLIRDVKYFINRPNLKIKNFIMEQVNFEDSGLDSIVIDSLDNSEEFTIGFLKKIVTCRLEEIIEESTKQANKLCGENPKIYLCGGVTELKGFHKILKRFLHENFFIYKNKTIGASENIFASVLGGIYLTALKEQNDISIQNYVSKISEKGTNTMRKQMNFANRLMELFKRKNQIHKH